MELKRKTWSPAWVVGLTVVLIASWACILWAQPPGATQGTPGPAVEWQRHGEPQDARDVPIPPPTEPPGPEPVPPPLSVNPPGVGPQPVPPPGPPSATTSEPASEHPYPAWVTEAFGPWTIEFLDEHPEVTTVLAVGAAFAKPLLFLFLFLLVGLLFSSLVRRALAPAQTTPGDRKQSEQQVERRAAAWSILVWAMALLIASEAVGVTWGGQITGFVGSLLTSVSQLVNGVLGLVGEAVLGAGIVIAVALVVYSAAPRGRDLILSLLGWYYLKYSARKPAPDQVFDLENGKSGTIDHVDLLHTVFRLQDGTQETRPNCFLMKTHFNWRMASDG